MVQPYALDNYLNNYLSGLDFPADAQNIIYEAQANRAPYDFMVLLDYLPNRVYNSLQDLYYTMIQLEVVGEV